MIAVPLRAWSGSAELEIASIEPAPPRKVSVAESAGNDVGNSAADMIRPERIHGVRGAVRPRHLTCDTIHSTVALT